MNTQQQENESYISYIKRVTELCLNKTISYSEWADCLLAEGNCYSEDNCRKGFYIVNKILNKIDDNIEFSEDSAREALEDLKDTIYKERVKLQDIVRSKRKMLRETSRIELLEEYMLSIIQTREPIDFDVDYQEITSNNEASLLVSDLHCGMVVDSIFNYYDIEVLKERMQELASKTIKFCKANSVSKLHVEAIGDFISGLIHNSLVAQSEEDVIDQVFYVSEILSEFLIELRNEIPEVIAYITYGNHGRTTQGKSDSANKTNFERLIAPYIKKTLKNVDIKVVTNGNEDFIPYNLRDGRLIVATHGTRDNQASANANFTKLLKQDVYEVHMGHYHDHKEGNGTVVNGSVIGSDDFSISLRKNAPSVQILKVYYEDGDNASFQLLLN